MKTLEQVAERFNLDFKNSFVEASAKETGYILTTFDVEAIFKARPEIFTVYLNSAGLSVAIFDRCLMRQ